jgi:aspartyl-tRNA(Asn)/glutamyl-tRNA(Gln) amidotransferase subunit A
MTSVDVLALPTTATSAPRMDAMTKYGNFEAPTFTMPFNVSGTPALSICNGFDAQGLPLSMQIVGRPFEDAHVLRVGHTYERMTSWRDRRPTL